MVYNPHLVLFTGVTQLTNYHKEVHRLYKPQKLGLVFPRLYDVPFAESVATAFLQVCKTACGVYFLLCDVPSYFSKIA